MKGFDYVAAQFGGEVSGEPVRAVIGDPITACDEKGFANNIRGAYVILQRGGCSFEEKARKVQQTGGRGMIVVDNRRGEPKPMTPGDSGAKDIKIPCVMVKKGSLAEMQSIEAMSHAGNNMVGRMARKKSP